MSTYLSCVVKFDSDDLAIAAHNLLARSTRPIFEEDVSPGDVDYFKVIDKIEFPTSMIQSNAYLVIDWVEKDRFDFRHLLPLFGLKGITLMLAHEMDSYIGSGDDDEDEHGRYWFVKGSDFDCCNASKLVKTDYINELNLFKKIRS